MYDALVHSELTGWTTVLRAPRAAIDRSVDRSLRMLAVGGAILLLFGLGAAVVFGKRISRPIASLAHCAEAIQGGEQTDLKPSAVREVRQLQHALLSAGAAAREAALEREQLLIAEAKRAEAEAANKKIGNILESMSDGFCALDREWRFTYFNERAKQQLARQNLDWRQLLGKIVWEAFPEHAGTRWYNALQRAMVERVTVTCEFYYQPLDEWYEDRAYPTGENGVAVYRRNITERKKMEAERKRNEEALKEADRRKDEFIAMLGHELRNPLGIIGNSVQILRRQEPHHPESQEWRDIIERQVKDMARIVDDLLDVSRISHGRIQLEKQRCDVAEVVRQTAEDHRAPLQTMGLRLDLNVPDQPVWVTGDRTRLAQALANLLHNCGKFTEPGGAVTVTLERKDQSATLTVSDTGIGMDEEVLAWVFEPFSQADRSLDRSRGGLGLGLALVKGIVGLHGGEVTASSQGPGRGSAFTICLPLERGVAQFIKPPAATAADAGAYRILVIEDNPLAAKGTRILLEQMGHIVEVARNGADGLEIARRFRPEVVLCDIGLPGLDGYEVAKALRQESEFDQTYIIGVSGYAQDERRTREAGFNVYLTKPVDFDELGRILAGLKARPEHVAVS